ncbi:MAG: sulfatase-like hydrolase/transferase [Asticcacaulis sp.]
MKIDLLKPEPRKRPALRNGLLAAWSALVVFPASMFALSADAAPKRPNVLVILADDLGYGETGFQGYAKDIPTPNIDSLAASGVRFTQGYVSGPYCSPTRAGLLTGRYQQRTGHEFNPNVNSVSLTGDAPGLALSEKTIGDRFRAAGYKTAFVGKSHQGYTADQNPINRGFDEFYGFLSAGRPYSQFEAPNKNVGNVILRGLEPVKASDYAPGTFYTTDVFANEASGFITRNKDKPWLLYLAFNAVHGPLDVSPKYEARFSHIKDEKRRKFAALLSALDDGVGTVLTTLRAAGLEEDTLIVFLSDNGGPTRQTTSANGPLRGYKSQTWEGGVRVPFVVQWKGHLPAGKTEDKPIIQLDVLPTVLAAAGVAVKPEWQLAVRQGDWKLVKAVDGGGVEGSNAQTVDGKPVPATLSGVQLYNLAKDAGEANNLAAQELQKVKELSALWTNWNKANQAPRWTAPGGNAQAAAKPKASAEVD